MMESIPPEFQSLLTIPRKKPAVAETALALEAFANEIKAELGKSPQLYQVNRARLALADRHELLRRATPARMCGKLDEAFNRAYADLFDRYVKLQPPDLSPPPVVQPAPEPKRPRSTAEALDALFASD